MLLFKFKQNNPGVSTQQVHCIKKETPAGNGVKISSTPIGKKTKDVEQMGTLLIFTIPTCLHNIRNTRC